MNVQETVELCNNIAKESSTIKKLALLKPALENKDFCTYLKYVYDKQSFVYGVTTKIVKGWVIDRFMIEAEWLLKEVNDSLKSVTDHKQDISHNRYWLEEIKNTIPQCGTQLIYWAVDRSCNLGLGVREINKLYNQVHGEDLIKQYTVMLAVPFDKKKLVFPCVVEPKYDGIRCIVEIEGTKVTLRTRNGIDITKNFPEIVEELSIYPTYDVILDGELTSITKDTLMTIVFNKGGNVNNVPVYYNVFDFLFNVDDKYKISFTERKINLKHSIIESKHILIAPSFMVYNQKDLDECYKVAIGIGFEGVVIKNPQAVYQLKRSTDWMKLKPFETYDLKVVGIQEGERSFEGKVGALLCTFEGGSTEVGSGFTISQRKEWWENPDLIMGKIIEVKAKGITKDGALEFPSFVGVREDK